MTMMTKAMTVSTVWGRRFAFSAPFIIRMCCLILRYSLYPIILRKVWDLVQNCAFRNLKMLSSVYLFIKPFKKRLQTLVPLRGGTPLSVRFLGTERPLRGEGGYPPFPLTFWPKNSVFEWKIPKKHRLRQKFFDFRPLRGGRGYPPFP